MKDSTRARLTIVLTSLVVACWAKTGTGITLKTLRQHRTVASEAGETTVTAETLSHAKPIPGSTPSTPPHEHDTK